MNICSDSVKRLCKEILISCPFQINSENCPLYKYKNSFFESNLEIVDNLDFCNQINILYEHSECFNRRIREKGILKKPTSTVKTVCLNWTCRTNIGFLTHELKVLGWIKSQNEFAKLFSPQSKNEYKVRWRSDKLEELTILFYKMREKRIFFPLGSKGYFKYLEDHIVDFNENNLQKNKLKKLCFLINKYPCKYQNTISIVNGIIDNITNVKELLRNY